MKKNLFFTLLFIVLAFTNLSAQQTIEIPLEPDAWEFTPESVEFHQYKSRPVMELITGEPVILKDFDFKDGTIEFDIELTDPRFSQFYFRVEDESESECFYFRTARAGDPDAVDAIQYAPLIKGVNLWDMLFQYQSNAEFWAGDWNHVKLVISGKQMKAYVNDMVNAALEVPYLEGDVTSGTLGFNGKSIISNLTVIPNAVEGLSPEPGLDSENNDSRYIRKWQVTNPVTMDEGVDFKDEYVPGDMMMWHEITAERRGLINLTRKFGIENGSRRIVWLKTTIRSERDQEKILRMGFSDEVWVLINDAPLFLDKNIYATPMQNSPDGRISIENSAIKVPLQEGENELLVGVSNYFYGWGIVSRFDDLQGIHLER